MAGWLIPVIQGAATVGTGLMGYRSTRDTNRTNERIAGRAQAFDLNMWNLQNQYNSPTAQMDRLRAAKLNPNLIYGSGNVTGNISSVPPKGREYHYESPIRDLADNVPNLIGILSQYQGMRFNEAQVDLTRQKKETEFWNTEAAKADAEMKTIDALVKTDLNVKEGKGYQPNSYLYDQALLKIESLRLLNELKRYDLNHLKPTQLLNIIADTASKGLGTKLKQLDIDRNTELAPYSMTTKDHILYRMLIKSFGRADDWASEQFQKRFKVDHGKSFYGSGGSW